MNKQILLKIGLILLIVISITGGMTYYYHVLDLENERSLDKKIILALQKISQSHEKLPTDLDYLIHPFSQVKITFLTNSEDPELESKIISIIGNEVPFVIQKHLGPD